MTIENEMPNHIGVVSGTGDDAGLYLITAEFKGYYVKLETYRTVGEAEAALPEVKSRYLTYLRAYYQMREALA